jgi:RNA polymerase sigma factor for flagellar operon FliA
VTSAAGMDNERPDVRRDIVRYLRLVRAVAYRMARRLPTGDVDVDDLVSVGVIGLMDAAKRFDPARVDRFESFAEFRVRGAMLDYLRTRDTLSRPMRELSNELRAATAALEGELGRDPSPEEMAQRLGIDLDEYRARQQKLSGSLVVGIDDAGPDLLERVADQAAADPFDLIARREVIDRISAAVAEMPNRTRLVFLLYYRRGMLMREIGEVLGVTESRACQLHRDAIRHVREALGLGPTLPSAGD